MFLIKSRKRHQDIKWDGGKSSLPSISLPRPLSPDNDIKARVLADLRIEPSKEEIKAIESQIVKSNNGSKTSHVKELDLLKAEATSCRAGG